MAIVFVRARYLSLPEDNAVRTPAYNGRMVLNCERTHEEYDFRYRGGLDYHKLMLPEGAPSRFADANVLWNAVEDAEHRKDSQLARELVLALPADEVVSRYHRIALARSFAEKHFVSKGLAVQLDIHAPEVNETECIANNWHAHLLITTRRVEAGGLSRLKARDLDPVVRTARGRPVLVSAVVWHELWREHQDEYFREQGWDLRVDPPGPLGQLHVGPRRMRVPGSLILDRAEARLEVIREAARDPDLVLDALTRNNATFTRNELTRYLTKHLRGDAEAIEAVREAILDSANPNLVYLYDRESGEHTGRFTTAKVRDQERTAMAVAAELARQDTPPVSPAAMRAAVASRTLRADQKEALVHASGAGNLKLIEGRAGTGKSYTLSAIRDACQHGGRKVIALAPTNAVARDMEADGFSYVATVHSELFRLNRSGESWEPGTTVIVDEAAMLSAPILGELLAAAHRARAKLILVGDDRQLGSIERGGLFSELLQRHPSAAITEVVRQKGWQRQAARDLAEYRFTDAIAAFERNEMITWKTTQDQARRALVAAWRRDIAARQADIREGRADRDETRFVFAYTNRDVDMLNAELRKAWRGLGRITGPDVTFDTVRGRPARDGNAAWREGTPGSEIMEPEEREEFHRDSFAEGDRVQITRTDKIRRLYNGNIGTITRIDRRTGQIFATLDGPGGRPGREVTWNAYEFKGFRHGYAGTIHKGQGKTLDRTYLYHTAHWNASPSYVALTRQRKSAEIFVATQTAPDWRALARQMARTEIRSASLAWATRDEIPRVREAEAGRARFLDEYQSHLQERRARGERDALVHDLVEKWDRLYADYARQLPALDRDPAYGSARDRLKAFVQSLRDQPELLTALKENGTRFGLEERISLYGVVHGPDHVLDSIISECERVQRAERAPWPMSVQIEERPRPRDRGHGRE